MNTMEPVTLADYFERRKAMVDAALEACLPGEECPPEAVHAAMRHAALSSGKRLRPAIALAVADLAEMPPASVLDSACAVELAHTASLILDDLPCMDNAVERRGRPCTHVAFGEATALLATMGLLTLAFELVARNAAACAAHPGSERAVPLLARAIGAPGLVYGQALDLSQTGRDTSLEVLECIHHHKAGVLFLASLEIPARLLGMPEEKVAALCRFGADLGLAFQIADDLLDACVPDEDAGKCTFSAHLGVEGARARASALIESALGALEPFGAAAAPLRLMAEFVRARAR